MNELDKALDKYIQDANEQGPYYELVLNTQFFIPTNDEQAWAGKTEIAANESIAPIIVQSEGKRYMMLFDSEQRLSQWAKKQVSYAVLPGHAIAGMTPPGLHWAVNIGSGFAKEFVPDEIAWLKKLVSQSDETQEGQGE
ncbi:hypothetical protein DESUT3_36120 [Desulfuromonas versatilis]|uniref:SseB protein N-terminal domain-containing protein n=1 Tax=Desulfuromonas versatilis TaxID=2802975 RepID=A0ABN6E2H2_9BACT|nr:SseB family protein [Desulfuromonas versatilis]BCR06543.1 hypothetical protein DESUT3_36120 [Desulfuromonas versatilis]